MRGRVGRAAASACLSALLLASAAPSRAEDAAPEPSADAKSHDLGEVNKQLTNPVSELWSITFQQNNFLVEPAPGETNRWSNDLLFQPVLPVGISPRWNLVTRPVVPLVVSQPHPVPQAPGQIDRTVGFGDIALLQLLSPSQALVGDWLLGVGPTWIFPSASSQFTGQGKWQVGPGVVAGYLADKWIAGALVQNWWSFAGDADRASTNSMNLQPFAAWFLPNAWSIGYSGNILADWEAGSGQVWTVPIGLQIAKVVKLGRLPVRVALGGQWMAVHPDRFGQRWNLQLIVAPVLPKLVKGNLTDPRSLRFGLGH